MLVLDKIIDMLIDRRFEFSITKNELDDLVLTLVLGNREIKVSEDEVDKLYELADELEKYW